MGAVDTSKLEKAVTNLGRALSEWKEHRTGRYALMARHSMILEFEICFGQLSSPLRRSLIDLDAVDPELVKTMSFTSLLRTAAQRGYTRRDVEQWDRFRRDRNLAAHAYDEVQANLIAEGVPEFLSAAEELLTVIRRKQDAT